MFIFRKLPNPDNRFDNTSIDFTIQPEVMLEDLLEEFGNFLRACGYSFDGSVAIEPPEVPL